MRERKQNRHPSYDYSTRGAYFITINIAACNRNILFGEIIDNRMILNEYGVIADKCWKEIPEHIENVFIDEYIIMPDHVHGIVFISPPPVRERHACPVRGAGPGRQHQKLPVIIGSYKSAVSKLIRRAGNLNFKWQRSYHDRIIRDYFELYRIQNYIRNNPVRQNGIGPIR